MNEKINGDIQGWIYVIENPSCMPGLVKIGYTLKDPLLRARELENTGIPTPYQVAYKALVPNPRDIERFLHLHFREKHEGKEWFRASTETVVGEIRKVISDQVLFSEGQIPASSSGLKTETPQQETVRRFREVSKIHCSICGLDYISSGVHQCDRKEWPIISCRGCGISLRVPPNKTLFVKCPKCHVKFKAST